MTELTDPREMFFAGQALWYVLSCAGRGKKNALKILDVGCGTGEHARVMREYGHYVTTIDMKPLTDLNADGEVLTNLKGGRHIVDDFNRFNFKSQYDVVWCSHMLEHQVNPGAFLQKLQSLVKRGGLIVVTVPPRKDEIVGGHVTLWNPGLLVYNMILAGIDCSNAIVQSYGYNITVAVRHEHELALPDLVMDNGDIERIAQYFPVDFVHGQNGWFAAGELE